MATRSRSRIGSILYGVTACIAIALTSLLFASNNLLLGVISVLVTIGLVVLAWMTARTASKTSDRN